MRRPGWLGRQVATGARERAHEPAPASPGRAPARPRPPRRWQRLRRGMVAGVAASILTGMGLAGLGHYFDGPGFGRFGGPGGHRGTTPSDAPRALRVATVNSPTTCYDGPGRLAGYECELVNEFARSLGVSATVVVLPSVADALAAVARGEADFAAAGLVDTGHGPTPGRPPGTPDAPAADAPAGVIFSRPVDRVSLQLVYRMGDPRPADWDALDGAVAVPAASAALPLLRRVQAAHPNVAVREAADQGEEDLIYAVVTGRIPYAVVASNLAALNQHYYPRLRVAFDIGPAHPVAWAFPAQNPKGGPPDPTLRAAADAFLDGARQTRLARLHDRYYGFVGDADFFSAVQLMAHIQSRLPAYRQTFERVARDTGLDWQLLAAIAYQESHWDADAVSPTGVKGLMMLTQDTAETMEVADRENARESIKGGARYFRGILDQVPAGVAEPDRTWLALAAYNMGPGHLTDVQLLARRLKRDPGSWLAVRNLLPLLAQPRWFSRLPHGYARGREALAYVENVRAYQHVLSWFSDSASGPEARFALRDARSMAASFHVPEPANDATAGGVAAPASRALPPAVLAALAPPTRVDVPAPGAGRGRHEREAPAGPAEAALAVGDDEPVAEVPPPALAPGEEQLATADEPPVRTAGRGTPGAAAADRGRDERERDRDKGVANAPSVPTPPAARHGAGAVLVIKPRADALDRLPELPPDMGDDSFTTPAPVAGASPDPGPGPAGRRLRLSDTVAPTRSEADAHRRDRDRDKDKDKEKEPATGAPVDRPRPAPRARESLPSRTEQDDPRGTPF